MTNLIQKQRKETLRSLHLHIQAHDATDRLFEATKTLRDSVIRNGTSQDDLAQFFAVLIAPVMKQMKQHVSRLRREVREWRRDHPPEQQRQYWATVVDDIHAGDLRSFEESLALSGPSVFAVPEIQDVLNDLWVKGLYDTPARNILKAISPMLGRQDGRSPLPDAEKKAPHPLAVGRANKPPEAWTTATMRGKRTLRGNSRIHNGQATRSGYDNSPITSTINTSPVILWRSVLGGSNSGKR